MYVGHLGVALGAKRVEPRLPLWALLLAAQGPDWVDAVFAGFGMAGERSAMWSHSIPSAVVVALLATAAARAKFSVRGSAWVLFVTYLLHLPADYLTGHKPLFPGGPSVGLWLYGRPALDFVIELAVITGGWWLYRGTLPSERRNAALAWVLLLALAALQAAADVLFVLRNVGATIW